MSYDCEQMALISSISEKIGVIREMDSELRCQNILLERAVRSRELLLVNFRKFVSDWEDENLTLSDGRSLWESFCDEVLNLSAKKRI